MKTYEFGNDEPTYSIVGGTHGDEPRTAEVIEAIREHLQDKEINHRLTLLIANERALEQKVRYTEVDLNRSYPGDKNSDKYEERLAYEIYSELKDTESVLSLHSTMSAPPPFAITPNIESNMKSILSFPVDYVVDTSKLRGTTMDTQIPQTVTVEIGQQRSQEAFEFGYETALSYLRTHQVLTDKPVKQSKKRLVKAERELKKSRGEPHVYFQNFERIPKGAVIAEDDGVQYVADKEGLTPVLMSEEGYEDVFGLVGELNSEIEP